MVSSDSLAVAVQLPAQFRGPCLYSDHAVAGSLLALNGYVHYRIQSNRTVTRRWALALSVMDAAMVTAGIAISSSGFQNSFFVLYYPALAMFAVVFTSFRLSFAWATMVAVVYAALSLVMEPGVEYEIKEEKILFTRIVVMYAVVAAVNLVSRFERTRRREAAKREELANAPNDEGRDELIAKLEAIHALSKSTMWELRHPIDAGPIFEGREFGRVLSSHASTFTTITSIPTEVEQSGREPRLSTVTRGLLFSIAHNAMTNAFRHSRADRVAIALSFDADRLRMSVSDDGIGLPDDYADRGHGFRNMRRDVERMGGSLEVGPGESGRGTSVTCVVPYDANRGGK
ncbi:Sensor histidine kinase MctS [Geodia barretti]|uniref:Sensor histidine kinase MctS n=1 Tax=Geodia barretti TaxID=519541 RepID=A0AA35T594_GEOBA|nr:Sensor histidine kinase MctS [Geodia barretti]